MEGSKRHDPATYSPLTALTGYQLYSTICKTQKSMAKKLKNHQATKHLFAVSVAYLNK